MQRIVIFSKDMFVDGYSFVGVFAPLFSIMFTLAKWQEWPITDLDLREISYAWAFSTLSVWFLISYIRRWLKYQTLMKRADPLSEVDYSIWDPQTEFRVYEAIFLWFKKEPPSRAKFSQFATREMLNLHEDIHDAINSGHLAAVRETGATRTVGREDLRSWAASRGDHPEFLFPEIR